MVKLIIVIGLPGSGKSYKLYSLKEKGEVDFIYDDFHGKSKYDIACIENSRHYIDLMDNLMTGHTCAISDIEFCLSNRMAYIIDYFKKQFGDIEIRSLYFNNDQEACSLNILRNQNRNNNERLAKIKLLSNVYVVPNGAEVMEVYKD